MAEKKQQSEINEETARREATRRRIYEEAIGESSVNEEVQVKSQVKRRQEEGKQNDQIKGNSAKKAQEDKFNIKIQENLDTEIVNIPGQEYTENVDNPQQDLALNVLNKANIKQVITKLPDDTNIVNRGGDLTEAGVTKIDDVNNIADEEEAAIDTPKLQGTKSQSLGISGNIEFNEAGAIRSLNRNIEEGEDSDDLVESLSYLVTSDVTAEVIEVIRAERIAVEDYYNRGSEEVVSDDNPAGKRQTTIQDDVIESGEELPVKHNAENISGKISENTSSIKDSNNNSDSAPIPRSPPKPPASKPSATPLQKPINPGGGSLFGELGKPKLSTPTKILQELQTLVKSASDDLEKLLEDTENAYLQIGVTKSISVKGRVTEFIKNAQEIYSLKSAELNTEYLEKTKGLSITEANDAAISLQIQGSLQKIRALGTKFNSYAGDPIVIKALKDYELVQDAQKIIEMIKGLKQSAIKSDELYLKITGVSAERTVLITAIKAAKDNNINFQGKVLNTKTAAGALKTYSKNITTALNDIAKHKFNATKIAKDIKILADRYSANTKVQDFYTEVQSLLNGSLTKNLDGGKIYLTQPESNNFATTEKSLVRETANYKSPFEPKQKSNVAVPLRPPPPSPQAQASSPVKKINPVDLSKYDSDPKVQALKIKYIDKVKGFREDLKLKAAGLDKAASDSDYALTKEWLDNTKYVYLVKNATTELNFTPNLKLTEVEVLAKFEALKVSNINLYTKISNNFYQQLFQKIFVINNELDNFSKSFNKMNELYSNAMAEFELEQSKLELFTLAGNADDSALSKAITEKLQAIIKQVESTNNKSSEMSIKDGKNIFDNFIVTPVGKFIHQMSQLNKSLESSFSKTKKEIEDAARKISTLISELEKLASPSLEKLNELATAKSLFDDKLKYQDFLLSDAESTLISAKERREEKVAQSLKKGEKENANTEDIKGIINILSSEYKIQYYIKQKTELNTIIQSYVDFNSPAARKVFNFLGDKIHNEEITNTKITINKIITAIKDDLRSVEVGKTIFDKSIAKNITDLMGGNLARPLKIVTKADLDSSLKKHDEKLSKIHTKLQELDKNIVLIERLVTKLNDQTIMQHASKLLADCKNETDAIKIEITAKSTQSGAPKYKEEYNKLLKILTPIAEKAKQEFLQAKEAKEKAVNSGATITGTQIEADFNKTTEAAKKWASLAGVKDPTISIGVKKIIQPSKAAGSKASGIDLIQAIKGSSKAMAQQVAAAAEELAESKKDIKDQLNYEDALASLLGFVDQLVVDYSYVDSVTKIDDLKILGANISAIKV